MSTNTIGFGGMLTILFIGLKLTECVTWGWLWVLSPLWIPVAIVTGIIIIAITIIIIMHLIKCFGGE